MPCYNRRERRLNMKAALIGTSILIGTTLLCPANAMTSIHHFWRDAQYFTLFSLDPVNTPWAVHLQLRLAPQYLDGTGPPCRPGSAPHKCRTSGSLRQRRFND